jgi:hypothetical protein
MGSYYYLPYVTSDGKAYESVKTQQIPPGELAVHRGTRVEAKDGYVGKVDEFVVNPKNGQHYPFGDAGRTSMGKERCDHSPFSNG